MKEVIKNFQSFFNQKCIKKVTEKTENNFSPSQ